jgi:hypothetical protein
MLRVLPRLPTHVKYVVIGDGEDRERLEELAKPVKDQVKFITTANDEQRNQWLAAADLFVLLTRDKGRDVEGFGIVCLEAALAGLPVVAGRSGGVTEAVQDGVTGLLVEPTDEVATKQAIERLINQPELRQQLGQAGRERALRDFKWEDRWQMFADQIHAPISIVIPVYNNVAALIRALWSLETQAFLPSEVIIIDDGSATNIEQDLKKYVFKIDYTISRLSENSGAPMARNIGFKRSTQPFVMFLDADARLSPQALQKLYLALEDNPGAAFAYSSFKFGWKLFRGRRFDIEVLKQANFIHTSALIRREAFPGFDPTLKKFQDWDLWLTMAERGGLGVWVPEVLMKISTGGTMSRWLPSFVYRLPWSKVGWMPREIKRYREAETIVMKKHGI